ncbi:hypothetical protein B6U93_01190 [Candidatus Woesearchaeota archaeon ex4484_78]|nr:MAG: hypothetical protein B6U93_01190 [Candidatus Woesearchaeota archaeon ex4484_78]
MLYQLRILKKLFQAKRSNKPLSKHSFHTHCICTNTIPISNTKHTIPCKRAHNTIYRLCNIISSPKGNPEMKRTKIDIVYDMLKAIEAKGGKILPTHLLYKSNLSHKRMKLYLEELKKKNVIQETIIKEKKYYEMTEDGWRFLHKLKQVREFTDAFGI